MLFLCALASAGLVRRQAAEAVELALCGDAADACRGMQGLAGRPGLEALLPGQDVDAYLAASGLAGDFSCRELCVATVRFAAASGVALPPAAGVACLDASCKRQVDVSSRALRALAAEEEQQREAEGAEHDLADVVTEEDANDGAEPLVAPRFGAPALSKLLMVLFGIFPVPEEPAPASLLEEDAAAVAAHGADPAFGPDIRHDRKAQYRAFAQTGIALLREAILKVESRSGVVTRFFGYKARVREVKEKFQKQLMVMQDLRLKKGSHDTCFYMQGIRPLAYVTMRKSYYGRWVYSSEQDEEGKYVVHMCERFWETVGRARYRDGVLIHEAAHHAGTTDVKLANGETAYGVEKNLELVREQGSEGALNNADNYMSAVLELAKSSSSSSSHSTTTFSDTNPSSTYRTPTSPSSTPKMPSTPRSAPRTGRWPTDYSPNVDENGVMTFTQDDLRHFR